MSFTYIGKERSSDFLDISGIFFFVMNSSFMNVYVYSPEETSTILITVTDLPADPYSGSRGMSKMSIGAYYSPYLLPNIPTPTGHWSIVSFRIMRCR